MPRDKGRLWRTDTDGTILNDADRDHIGAPFATVVADIIDAYVQHIENDLHSIYITGSVPRGRALSGESDIDAFAVLEYSVDPELVLQDWLEPAEARLRDAHACVTAVQMELWPQGGLFREPEEFSIFAFIVKTHSVCVWGSDLSHQLPDYRLPDVAVAVANDDLVQIEPDMEEAVDEIKVDSSPEHVAFWCKRISRNMLRAGFGLVMMDAGVHTRDLDLCYDYFAQHYPEQAQAMHRALDNAYNPTSDPAAILGYLDSFGAWLIAEADRWLDRHNPKRNLDYIFGGESAGD